MRIRILQIILMISFFMFACQAKTEKKYAEKSNEIQVDSVDLAIFNSLNRVIANLPFDSLPIGDQIIEIGKLFLQTPYSGGTLDKNKNEELVINLHQLDCTTYLENVLALSKSFTKPASKISDFSNNLKKVRYRDGELTNYNSRLHYFTDWIFNNSKKGIVADLTQKIGGEIYDKKINFMSTHVSAYPALVANDSLVDKIKETELLINSRKRYYIPEIRIESIESKIKDGDLIAITSKIKGLDVSHTGIAIHLNDRLHLIHASSKQKKVVISDLSLAEMLLKNKFQTGIIVTRVILND